MTMILAQV